MDKNIDTVEGEWLSADEVKRLEEAHRTGIRKVLGLAIKNDLLCTEQEAKEIGCIACQNVYNELK